LYLFPASTPTTIYTLSLHDALPICIAKQYFRPVFGGLAAVLRDGQGKGEFRGVDPMHFIPSMIAMIVFYFTNAPVMRMVTGRDPFSPEFLAQRRAAVLDFISAALFQQPDERSRK